MPPSRQATDNTVGVRSAEGNGSTFEFTVPLAAESDAQAP